MKKSTIVVLAVLFVVRALFAFTYVPDASGADAPSYGVMAASGKLNIIFAPGAPWLFGMPFRLLGDTDEFLSKVKPTDNRSLWHHLEMLNALERYEHKYIFIYGYCLTTLLFDYLLLCISCFIISSILGNFIALLAISIIGLSPFHLASVYTFAPEGVQGITILLFLLFALYYYKKNSLLTLFLCYVVISVSFIIKYNNIYFIFAIFVLLFVDFVRRHKRLILHFVFIVFSFSLIYSFFYFVYRPQTGTMENMDRSWVLLDDLRFWSPKHMLHLDAGDETRRLYILNSRLPSDFGLSAFEHVDFIFGDMRPLRRAYRTANRDVIDADHDTLVSLLKQYPQTPPTSSAHMFLPTFACIGPDYSNALGTRVWLEHVLRFPLAYAASVVNDTFAAIFGDVTAGRNYYIDRIPEDGTPGVRPQTYGFSLIASKANTDYNRFLSDRILIWRPGQVFFSVLIWAYSKTAALWYLFLIVTSVAAALERNRGLTGRLLIAATVICIGFVGFSNAVFIFRPKEAATIFPVLGVALALAIAYWRRRQSETGSAAEK